MHISGHNPQASTPTSHNARTTSHNAQTTSYDVRAKASTSHEKASGAGGTSHEGTSPVSNHPNKGQHVDTHA